MAMKFHGEIRVNFLALILFEWGVVGGHEQ